jgi:S-adenosylmethionine synthetase
MAKRFFTSESVTEGHPDKICDQISDAVLDEFLRYDKYSRVACETSVTTGLVHLLGEYRSNARIDFEGTARRTIREIGYTKSDYGFDASSCGVLISLHGQSPDISRGVDVSLESRRGASADDGETGAGDQGMMIGYACEETAELMPMPIIFAHRLVRRLAAVRKDGVLSYLRPDGKSQVTVEYIDDVPKRVEAVVIAAHHDPEVSQNRLGRDIVEHVIRPVIPENLLDSNTRFLVNTTGRFEIGGPKADSGLTGRKIIVDTYGGVASHGGGAFSGKDPSKVDRTSCYAARHVAKNIVAAKLATRCSIEIAYAIGVARPLSIFIDTHGTGVVQDERLVEMLQDRYDFRPSAIIRKFDMLRPIYREIAAYGHFGRNDLDLGWEKVDLAEDFRRALL